MWKVMDDCCQKDFFINNSCRALAEIVQILNEFCRVVSLMKDTVTYCMLYMCLLSQVMYRSEHSNHLSSSILGFN